MLALLVVVVVAPVVVVVDSQYRHTRQSTSTVTARKHDPPNADFSEYHPPAARIISRFFRSRYAPATLPARCPPGVLSGRHARTVEVEGHRSPFVPAGFKSRVQFRGDEIETVLVE